MKKKYIATGVAVLSILIAAAGASSVLAASSNIDKHQGGRAKMQMTQKNNLTDEQKAEWQSKREAVKSAISSGDYKAWVSAETALNAKCPLLEKINADNFSKYAEAVKLREQADGIMEDLGLPGREGFGPGSGQGLRFQNQTR